MALGGQPITKSMAKEVAKPRQSAITVGSTPSNLAMGITMGKIKAAAAKLDTISKASEWHKGQSEEFLRYSKNFQEAV